MMAPDDAPTASGRPVGTRIEHAAARPESSSASAVEGASPPVHAGMLTADSEEQVRTGGKSADKFLFIASKIAYNARFIYGENSS